MSGHNVSDWQGWRVGVINLKCAAPDKPVDVPVAGWTKDAFGLDFRVIANDDGDYCIPGWCLTHLPTGFVVRYIDAGHIEALSLADEIAAAGDWDFTDPAEGKLRGPAVKAVMDKHPGKLFGSRRALRPRA